MVCGSMGKPPCILCYLIMRILELRCRHYFSVPCGDDGLWERFYFGICIHQKGGKMCFIGFAYPDPPSFLNV